MKNWILPCSIGPFYRTPLWDLIMTWISEGDPQGCDIPCSAAVLSTSNVSIPMNVCACVQLAKTGHILNVISPSSHHQLIYLSRGILKNQKHPFWNLWLQKDHYREVHKFCSSCLWLITNKFFKCWATIRNMAKPEVRLNEWKLNRKNHGMVKLYMSTSNRHQSSS